MNPAFRLYAVPIRVIAAIAVVIIALSPPARLPARGEGASLSAIPQPHLVPAVLFVGGDSHIYEIALKGTWQARDLTVAAGGAPLFSTNASEPMGFRRGNGVSMVVYRAANDHVIALYLELVPQGNTWQETWHWVDLSAITGAPLANSDPFGYVRSDGVSTVVYVGDDRHVHELRLQSIWIWADLSSISGAPYARRNIIFAFVRSDGVNTIIFESEAYHILEIRLDGGWVWADLTAISGAPVTETIPSNFKPISAFVRSDGIETINFTCANKRLHEIRLENTWIWTDLTTISGAPASGWWAYHPAGYVRGDGMNTVIYQQYESTWTNFHIHELRLQGTVWIDYELTSITDATDGYTPVGYVRADGVSAVVYRSMDLHVREIWLSPTGWQAADLTAISSAPLTTKHPWPYNRSGVAHTYLPVVAR